MKGKRCRKERPQWGMAGRMTPAAVTLKKAGSDERKRQAGSQARQQSVGLNIKWPELANIERFSPLGLAKQHMHRSIDGYICTCMYILMKRCQSNRRPMTSPLVTDMDSPSHCSQCHFQPIHSDSTNQRFRYFSRCRMVTLRKLRRQEHVDTSTCESSQYETLKVIAPGRLQLSLTHWYGIHLPRFRSARIVDVWCNFVQKER